MKAYLVICLLLSAIISCAQDLGIVHLHNDYLIEDEILERALEYNVGRVEVDVRPYKSKLVVSHGPFSLKSKKSIDELYFEKLVDHFNQHTIFASDSQYPITIFIDIKSKPNKSLILLRQLVVKYSSYIYRYTSNEESNAGGLIKLVLSGKLPIKSLTTEDFIFFRLDGDFSKSYPPSILPYITHMSCPIKVASRISNNQLKCLVDSAHYHNRTARFYKVSHSKENWRMLLNLNVDFINIDDNFEEFVHYLEGVNE